MNILPGYRIAVMALTAFSIMWLCLHPLRNSQYGPQSDEGYYYTYANMVQHKGLPAFNELMVWYSSSEEAVKHPTPLRAGYILLISFLFKIFGPSFEILGLCSTLSFLLFLYVCFHYARKHFDLDTALLFILLLSSSPLMLGLSRRALLDSPINLLWGMMVWLFLDLLLKPHKGKYIALVVLLAVSITVKEMSIILIPFFVLAGLGLKSKGESIPRSWLMGIVLWPALLVLIFYGWILGGFSSLAMVVSTVANTHLNSHCTNPYAIKFSSGPWFRYMLDFLLLNPIVTLLFTGYVGYLCVQRSQLDLKRTYFLFYFIFVYACLNLLPHTKVVRFVVNLEMVMALFALLMVGELFKSVNPQKAQRWTCFIVFGIFIYNWASFMKIFYDTSLLDPISLHLLILRNFIPAIK